MIISKRCTRCGRLIGTQSYPDEDNELCDECRERLESFLTPREGARALLRKCTRCGRPLETDRGYPDEANELCDQCLVDTTDCNCVSVDIPGCDQSCPGCRAAARLAYKEETDE